MRRKINGVDRSGKSQRDFRVFARISFTPFRGSLIFRLSSHGLRRGLYSVATSRLKQPEL
jgi:hypothetical protein